MARRTEHLPGCRPARGSSGRADGFTLLEVVVALIVFALVFGVVTQIVQSGFRQSRAAADTTTAALIARSVLARVGHDLPVVTGSQEGEAAGGYRWVVEIEPAPGGHDAERPLVLPYWVHVEVLWGEAGGARSIDLTTLRLRAAEP